MSAQIKAHCKSDLICFLQIVRPNLTIASFDQYFFLKNGPVEKLEREELSTRSGAADQARQGVF